MVRDNKPNLILEDSLYSDLKGKYELMKELNCISNWAQFDTVGHNKFPISPEWRRFVVDFAIRDSFSPYFWNVLIWREIRVTVGFTWSGCVGSRWSQLGPIKIMFYRFAKFIYSINNSYEKLISNGKKSFYLTMNAWK